MKLIKMFAVRLDMKISELLISVALLMTSGLSCVGAAYKDQKVVINSIQCITWSAGNQMAIGGADGKIYLVDPNSNQVTGKQVSDACTEAVKSVSWSTDGTTLAVACGNVLYFFNERLELLKQFTQEGTHEIEQVVWSPAGMYVAALTDGGRIYIWNYSSGYLENEVDLPSSNGPIKKISWSPDGQVLVCADNSTLYYI